MILLRLDRFWPDRLMAAPALVRVAAETMPVDVMLPTVVMALVPSTRPVAVMVAMLDRFIPDILMAVPVMLHKVGAEIVPGV